MADDLEGVIHIRAKLQQENIVSVKHRLALFVRHRKFLQIGHFITAEFLAAFGLVQRHAEHVQMIPLTVTPAVENISSRNIVIVAADHRAPPAARIVYHPC